MSAQQNFRTAIGGFKKEDVVKYIEYINAKHAAQVGQMKTEFQNLQQELQELRYAVPSEDLSEKVSQLEERCAAAEQERDALQAKLAEAEITQEKKLAEQELEAYRRAERAERVAQERAQVIYDQANGVLADATVKVDEAVSHIGELTEQVNQQLEQLQSAIAGSKQALKEASATLYAIRPEAE
jgi:chromosome segregation ATPase